MKAIISLSLGHRWLAHFTVAIGVWLVASGWYAGPCSAQDRYYVELKNGMRFGPGIPNETDSLSQNAFQRGSPSGQVQSKSIAFLDDGLRRTFYNGSMRNLQSIEKSQAQLPVELELPAAAEAATTGNPPTILGVLGVSQFNNHGRRRYVLRTPSGRQDVLQGITLLTPLYARLEALRTGKKSFPWDQRIAISTIPAKTLREILKHEFDLNKPNEWRRLISFYTQAERYVEASQMMEEALERFPQTLANLRPVAQQLNQLVANQKFEEINIRRDAGQHKLAAQLLYIFPKDTLPFETQAKLDDEVTQLQSQLNLISQMTEALKQQLSELPAEQSQAIEDLADELLQQVNLDSAARLADFQRLGNDQSLPIENRVALALGGWLLGPGSGMDNFEVVKSLHRVRTLVREYLNEDSQPDRQRILSQLKAEEGAQPDLLAKLIEFMPPPQTPPEAHESGPPGLHRLAVTMPDGNQVQYLVQVPPEYDPYRKYPCVLSLPGRGFPLEMQIDWWCGPYVPEYESRFGHATRYGYIVVVPDWMTEDQSEYQYTEMEKARVLKCLRDALRKFSIDTDRVFISGHHDGATCAWDIALSHPDPWAGAIMLSPGADKYIAHYSDNIRGKTPDEIPLATYIVFGDHDGTRYENSLGKVLTDYLSDPRWECLAVEYQGRGREHFLEELPRIIDWMELSSHRRLRTPREINVKSMRPGDRFFYWLEAPAINPSSTTNPFQLDASNYGKFEAVRLNLGTNGIQGVRINSIPSRDRNAVIWLSPTWVDFNEPFSVILRGDRESYEISPDIEVMLEDVRQRGDRQHFFWQRIEAR